jgi:hypothetical protein
MPQHNGTLPSEIRDTANTAEIFGLIYKAAALQRLLLRESPAITCRLVGVIQKPRHRAANPTT